MTTSQSADLAISSGSQTHIWHAPGQQTNNFTVLKNAGSVNTSRWNQNNKVVVTAGETGQLVLNYINGTVMGVLPQESERKLPVINAVCFSKGSKYLATGCMNGEVFVWNLKRQVSFVQNSYAKNAASGYDEFQATVLVKAEHGAKLCMHH